MELLIGIASGLGGALLTFIGFIFGFSNRVSVMQSTLNELKKSFEAHVSSAPTCQFHTEINAAIEVLKEKARSD